MPAVTIAPLGRLAKISATAAPHVGSDGARRLIRSVRPRKLGSRFVSGGIISTRNSGGSTLVRPTRMADCRRESNWSVPGCSTTAVSDRATVPSLGVEG